MAGYDWQWEDLGRNVQDIVNRAVNSRDFQKLERTVRQAIGACSRTIRTEGNGAAYTLQARPSRLYGGTLLKTAKGVVQMLFGIPLGITGLGTLLGGNVEGVPVLQLPGYAIVFLLMCAGGAWLTVRGVKTMNMVKRFKVYRNLLGNKTHCEIDLLAQGVGKKVSFVRKELWRMIGNGLFRQGHLDKEENSLIVSDETYHHYEQSMRALEQRQKQDVASQSVPVDPKLQQILEQGNAFLTQIRKCNDEIPGEEISEKISRIELLVQRIFIRAEEDPDVVPELRQLMGYYLPMTVKLLEAYADMDGQPVAGQNIESAKREIEATLDTLNVAFEKLLDSIFKETSLDISSDISALNVLLAQEGLTEDGFSQIKNQNNAGTGE